MARILKEAKEGVTRVDRLEYAIKEEIHAWLRRLGRHFRDIGFVFEALFSYVMDDQERGFKSLAYDWDKVLGSMVLRHRKAF